MKVFIIIGSAIIGIIIAASIIFTCTPFGVELRNNWFGTIQHVDDRTNYDTQKKVEDTCRSMIASYNSDKVTYEQFNGSDSKEEQSWADQAKMRANKTASSYNNYILKNKFVWSENVPSDIVFELQYIK